MKQSLNIAVTGASGFIGSHLIQALLADGHQVFALSGNPHAFTHPSLQWFTYRLGDNFPAGIPQADWLIHLGYIPDNYDQNVRYSRELFTHFRKSGSKVLFMGSLSQGEAAKSLYGRQKRDVSKMLEDKDLLVRPGLVLGDGGLFRSMVSYILKSRFLPVFGGGEQPLQPVLIDDLIKAVLTMLERNYSGEFVIAWPRPVAYKEFMHILCAAHGRRFRPVYLPLGFTRMILMLLEKMGVKLAAGKENLDGLKAIEFVPSENSLHKVGIQLTDPWTAIGKVSRP